MNRTAQVKGPEKSLWVLLVIGILLVIGTALLASGPEQGTADIKTPEVNIHLESGEDGDSTSAIIIAVGSAASAIIVAVGTVYYMKRRKKNKETPDKQA